MIVFVGGDVGDFMHEGIWGGKGGNKGDKEHRKDGEGGIRTVFDDGFGFEFPGAEDEDGDDGEPDDDGDDGFGAKSRPVDR